MDLGDFLGKYSPGVSLKKADSEEKPPASVFPEEEIDLVSLSEKEGWGGSARIAAEQVQFEQQEEEENSVDSLEEAEEEEAEEEYSILPKDTERVTISEYFTEMEKSKKTRKEEPVVVFDLGGVEFTVGKGLSVHVEKNGKQMKVRIR